MSVYIKSMEMPSCCMFCPVSDSIGCGLTNPPFCMTTKEMLADRPNWCPLVSIPTHGRLVDADALEELFLEVIGNIAKRKEMEPVLEHMVRASAMVIEMIDDAPTIIEAEEGAP